VCVECLCGVKRQEIVVINGRSLFNNADYKVITEEIRADSLTASSAGVTVCSMLLICHAGWMSADGYLGFIDSSPL